MRLPRVLRGVLGTAVAWGLAWIPITLVTIGVSALFGGPLPPLHYFEPLLAGAVIRGAISGAAFAGVLAVAGRRRTFGTLRARDMLAWGAMGGLVASGVLIGSLVLTSAVSIPATAVALGLGWAALTGAVCGVGTLGIARRAPEIDEHPPAQLESGLETA